MNHRVIELNEIEFRQLVVDLHKQGHFSGDPHRMQVNFKLHSRSVCFVGIAYEDEHGRPFGFCGADVFQGSDGTVRGMIHCLGVIKSHRGRGYSKQLLLDIEQRLPKDLRVKEMLSICNPISARAHERVGYEITHPGRLTKTGKRSQIRLKKVLQQEVG